MIPGRLKSVNEGKSEIECREPGFALLNGGGIERRFQWESGKQKGGRKKNGEGIYEESRRWEDGRRCR